MTRLFLHATKTLVFTLLIGAFSVLPAYAQSNAEIENRLRRMENEMQTLGRAVFKGDVQQAPSSFQVQGGAAQQQQTQLANMGVRLAQMESQMRELTGQIEQQNFQIRQLKNQLQSQTMSQAQQFSQQPNVVQQPTVVQNTPQANVAPNQLGQIVQNQNGQPIVNTQNPAFLYDTAFSMLQSGDYPGSATAFNNFLQTYPTHPLAANAQYWLGETFYVRNNYADAAKSFAQGYQKYPQSPKAPDSLLKLSLSLSNLGKNEEACVTLGQLEQQYPKASSAIKAKTNEEKTRLSCG